MKKFFKKAEPIWVEKRNNERHLRVQFKCLLNGLNRDNVIIKIATSGIYNLFVNGKFVSYGPARAGKGHFRVDEIEISKYFTSDVNVVVLEVCGYYTNSYYIQEQESFIISEILDNQKTLAWTGKHFSARINPYYIQKVQRYSFQRPMIEAYRNYKADSFMIDSVHGGETIEKTDCGILENRYTPYPLFERIVAKRTNLCGRTEFYEPKEYVKDRSLTNIDEYLHGFNETELEICVTKEYQKMKFIPSKECFNGIIPENGYEIYQYLYDASGLINISLECSAPLKLYILFDEVLTDNKVDCLRMECANAIYCELLAGKHDLKFFEVYTMKYIQIVAIGASCKINSVEMIEYKHPPIETKIKSDDEEIQKIIDAAIETYRQNSVDLFTDSPTRERAGWLCDSYFTGNTEFCLTGKNTIEKSFLENFLHEDEYKGLPYGMLPMCYPADHFNGAFIPNWSLWLIIELKEYLERTKDRKLVDGFREKINRLLKYFKSFENEYGLLENLDGWVFVEWSKANDFVQDVNYPSNMLYSKALQIAGELFDDRALVKKSEKIKEVILKQSFNGTFFVDNAIRKDGKLVRTNNCTEVCQYYAFFFEIANQKTHKKLFETLIKSFGPSRDVKKVYPEIYPANVIIGNLLRLSIMLENGYKNEVLKNIKEYFGYMAKETGTLWEHVEATNSCNQMISSYVLCLLDKLL